MTWEAVLVAMCVLVGVTIAVVTVRRGIREDRELRVEARAPQDLTRDDDQRKDHTSRTRVAALEYRYRKVTRYLIIAGSVFLVTAVVSIGGLYYLYSNVQDSRRDASRDACIRDNRQNRGVQRFILLGPLGNGTGTLTASEVDAVKSQLNRDFPVIGPINPADERVADAKALKLCEERAAERIPRGP